MWSLFFTDTVKFRSHEPITGMAGLQQRQNESYGLCKRLKRFVKQTLSNEKVFNDFI
mgnify:CR=1 FL=1